MQRVRLLFIVVLITTASTLSGCGSRQIFSAQFDKQPIDDALIPKADVGFFREGPFGGASVVAAPDAGDTAHWVQIVPSAGPDTWAELDAFFTENQAKDGHYLFTARLFVPSGSRAGINFGFGDITHTEFLELDFPAAGIEMPMPGGSPGSPGVCCFPRDQVFTVTVDFTVGPTSKATVTLGGAAHGSFDVPLSGSPNQEPRSNFGSVDFWSDSHSKTGPFFVNDISVLYSP
jgi:hypothetical protein